MTIAEPLETYLQQPHVLKALGIEDGFQFKGINMEVHNAYRKSGDYFIPTTREAS
jgi:hypothetical protein